MRLNVGSGTVRLRDGYINLDANPECRPDIVASVPPLPFQDETFTDILASHFIEHLVNDDAVAFMAEVYRCLQPNGVLEVQVPYAFSHGAVQDPTHKSYWVIEKFLYFTPHFRNLCYGFEDRFTLERQANDGETISVWLRKGGN